MKTLVIVCEDRCRKYGDFLAQLISASDDEKENVVGVRDGAVVAQVWSEQQFKNQEMQTASSQYILFIGNSKIVKEKSWAMKIVYSWHGMSYGWLGRQGFLRVDGSMMITEAEAYNAEVRQLAEPKQENRPEEPEELKEDDARDENKIGKKGLIIANKLKKKVLVKPRIISKDEKYCFIVSKFYHCDLARFLEM